MSWLLARYTLPGWALVLTVGILGRFYAAGGPWWVPAPTAAATLLFVWARDRPTQETDE